MRCLCGYYHLSPWEIEREDAAFQDELKRNNGREEFINIKGDFFAG